ncbi:MAG: xylulokinase [Armatimonadaceae bacterium]
MGLFLGIDTGTSGTKAILVDSDGQLKASATVEYPLSTPHPQWAEQDPEAHWWPAAVDAIRAVLSQANASGNDVQGIGLTGQMHGAVFLDKSHRVLRPAMLWCDARTGDQCDEITSLAGGTQGLHRILGQPVLTSYTAPKILWVRQHEPDTYARIAKVLLPKDWIRFQLTGAFAAEVSDASGTSLLDVRTRQWSGEMLDKLAIPREWLADVHESTEITATVSAEAAELTGLRAGTPVVGGGGDQAAGAVGSGIVSPGQVSSSLGTSGVVFAYADSAAIDPQMRIQTYCHAVPGAWHLMGCVISAGGSLRWWRDTFHPGADYDTLVGEAAGAAPGCEGLLFLPYLIGERTPHPDPDARGVFFGATLRSDRASFTRAVLEGVAYAMNDSFTLLREAGVPVSEVRASGGGARSDFWLQMMADVCGAPHVRLRVDEGPALGAAILAAVGTGAYGSVPEACAQIVATTPGAAPGADAQEYNRWYPVYRSLYPALKDIFRETARRAANP